MRHILFLSLLSFAAWAAEPRLQGRSVVSSLGGIAAAEHPAAAQAAAQILADGGTAADAAIAANAVMGVVSPMMCGIGGDLFCLVYDAKSGRTYGLNASGWSPAALNAGLLRGQGFTNMPVRSIHTVTVPGAVDGWEKLSKRFGRMKLKEVLEPAIRLAEQGTPVTELTAGDWAAEAALLTKDPAAARTFLTQGRAFKTGEVFKNPLLASSYRQIARRGRKAFYDGPIAERIVAVSERLGGLMARADLKEFTSEWVEPISTTYRGWTVYEIPPNGQGIAALSMLNLMERFPIGQQGINSADALHAMIEAKKLAYADMLQHVADPHFSKVPAREMLSKKHAEQRARLIDAQKANCQPAPTITFEAGPDTTYLCVVDRDGNMVSLIQSIYYLFGSGLAPDDCGFILHNRGGLFSLELTHPNVLEGRKRPLHTIIPAMMEQGGQRIAFGIMGGWNQSQAHAQFVANVVDHGLNIQAALESPRFTKRTFEGCDVQIESRVDEKTRAELERRGHIVKAIAPFAQEVGGGQAVMRDDASGVNYGGSDPRKDGAAIPEPAQKRRRF